MLCESVQYTPKPAEKKTTTVDKAQLGTEKVSPGILASLNSGIHHQYCGYFVLIMFSYNQIVTPQNDI